jgi:hypothetical protein
LKVENGKLRGFSIRRIEKHNRKSLPLEAPEGRAKRKVALGGSRKPNDGDGGEAA